jgi:hypothetical protein
MMKIAESHRGTRNLLCKRLRAARLVQFSQRDDDQKSDIAMMDDFIYGEPQALP